MSIGISQWMILKRADIQITKPMQLMTIPTSTMPSFGTFGSPDSSLSSSLRTWFLSLSWFSGKMTLFDQTWCNHIISRLAIPDIPANLKYKIRREDYITKEIIIRTERLKKLGKLKPQLSESNPELRHRGPGFTSESDPPPLERNKSEEDLGSPTRNCSPWISNI